MRTRKCIGCAGRHARIICAMPWYRARLALLTMLGGALSACTVEAPQPRLGGLVVDGGLGEASGLAASRVHRDTFWLVEDGGNPAELHAISKRGRRLATYTIEGISNTDWEDLAAFELDGKRYLLIADTGDNGGLRRTLLLHVVAEPAKLEGGAILKPAWSIAFRWPDGARDCEAVAVDTSRDQILLLSKKRHPPELFVLPLHPHKPGLQVATRIGRLAGVPQASAEEQRAAPARARLVHHVTAADVSPDGRTLAVLTYKHLLIYPRAGNERWTQATRHPPLVRVVPWLPQPEAIAWTADGNALYATGEFSPAPLVYFPFPDPAVPASAARSP